MTSFSIRSFGCRVNQAEAFGWAEELQEARARGSSEDGERERLSSSSIPAP